MDIMPEESHALNADEVARLRPLARLSDVEMQALINLGIGIVIIERVQRFGKYTIVSIAATGAAWVVLSGFIDWLRHR